MEKVVKLTDSNEIRKRLSVDSIWCAYGLGDLSPCFFDDCEWFATSRAIVWGFKKFDPVCLVASGDADSIKVIIQNEITYPRIYISVQEPILSILETNGYVFEKKIPMFRMFHSATGRCVYNSDAKRLTAGDIPSIRQLYEDGNETNEAPDFFSDFMVSEGVFFGVFSETGELDAVAGTHVVSDLDSVGAVGCVYTRRSKRSQGLSGKVVAAVVNALIDQNIQSIVLNVKQVNLPAKKVYERLGFTVHCPYFEGIASKF